jgi:alanine racemase
MVTSLKQSHPAWIEVDFTQLRKNIALLRQHIGNCLFCLPVKANAYGHGLCPISLVAQEAGVDYLAVAHLQEGMKLRDAGIHIPILVLGAIHEDQIEDLIDFQLEFTISSKFKADLVAAICDRLKKKCRIHIEVDTGMQRTGVRAATAQTLFQYLKNIDCFEIVGIYSHLATADQPLNTFASKQIGAFAELLNDPIFSTTPLIRHLANSGGTMHYSSSHFDMVRPSLLAFGYLPAHTPEILKGISPCFSLKAKVSYFKVVAEGTGISYGHKYVTSQQTRIVTIPVGYGDGFRRSLSERGSVLIRGKRFPIRGTICMDQFMVEVGNHEVYVGDEVVLIGKQGDEEISLFEVAELCDSIPYEVLCLFNERIPRIYLP